MSSKNGPNEPGASRRPARQWSISRRLTMLYGASSFLMLLLAMVYVYWSLIGNLEREDNAVLADKIRYMRNLLREHPHELARFREEAQPSSAGPRPLEDYVRVLKASGEVIVETPGMNRLIASGTFPPAPSADEMPQEGVELKLRNGRTFRLISAWANIGAAADHEQYLVQVALDVSNDEIMMSRFRRNLLVLLLAGVAFACLAGVFIARKSLQPLEEITQATKRVTASQLHERMIPNGWPKELASLANGFDQMLDRLEDSFNRLSQFSGDLAHELRTPINNLRGEAGVALSQARTQEEYRCVLESSLEEYARLSRLIDNLLFLARADGTMTSVNRSPFDSRKAIEAVRDYYEALAEDRGIEVVCEGEATVDADPVLFRQAVSNLLANALNYTPRGGKVTISVAQRGGRVALAVADTGCGIAPENLPKIFDRFYRVDASRSQLPQGIGLGLAIVKSIMALHGGTAGVESEVGRGTTLTLHFLNSRSNAAQDPEHILT